MPTVPDSLAATTRAIHDVGLAAWLGGAMFGKFAHNPSLRVVTNKAERGQAANAAWNGYNVINAAGLGSAALGWTAARLTETQPELMSPIERQLSLAKDVLMGVAVVTGIANFIQGGRLAKQAPNGAVPVETGVEPAPETPPQAAKIQRSLGVLGNANIIAGVALVATNGVLSQFNYSRPSAKRALTRSASPGGSKLSPLTIGALAATAAAAWDQNRRLQDD